MSSRARSIWNGTLMFGEVEPEPEPVLDLVAALEASLSRVKTRA